MSTKSSSTKRYKSFLNYEVKRLQYILSQVESDLDHRRQLGYTDIREIFAGREYITDITSAGCEYGTLIVKFVMGDIESPIADYGELQVKEIHAFLLSKLDYLQRQQERLAESSSLEHV